MACYEDKESGVVFHYDLRTTKTNWIEIVVPPDAEGDGTSIMIPFYALFRFFFHLFGAGLDGRLRDVFARSIVTILNRAFQTDPRAIEALFKHKVTCNEKMIEDPTINVGYKGGLPTLGVLGLINGLIGREPWIGIKLDGNMGIRGFTVLRQGKED